MTMLHLQMVNAPALGDHVGQVQDLDGSVGIVRVRSALEDMAEAEAHNRDAIQFDLVRTLPRHSYGAGGKGRTDQKLSSFHHTYLGPPSSPSGHLTLRLPERIHPMTR